ncbi:MAG: hypothetical protein EKK64_00445 [Neisseriaceae bacterium]|nr:MAG: hypothetical protein EKK64_00445 [Neisseriaceae bacterium]
MKLVAKDSYYAVIDDVLPKEQFDLFWKYFNSSDYAYRSMTGWQKVWRITDGQVLAGPPSYHSQAPFNNPMDVLHQSAIALAKQHFEEIVGKEDEDWKEFFLTPYIYPAGTKISWHDDYGYTGACIYYTHPEWGANWGGELFIAKTPSAQEIQESNIAPDNITREFIDPLLNHYGMGMYFTPKPNRMIFTSGKVWHAINRVDQSAGDHARCSVVGFFSKEKII